MNKLITYQIVNTQGMFKERFTILGIEMFTTLGIASYKFVICCRLGMIRFNYKWIDCSAIRWSLYSEQRPIVANSNWSNFPFQFQLVNKIHWYFERGFGHFQLSEYLILTTALEFCILNNTDSVLVQFKFAMIIKKSH